MTWQHTVTAESNEDWTAQKFQLLRTGDGTYQIRCRWGGLFLTASKDGSVPTAPLSQHLNQHWQLFKAD
jgi:hypothetical protein